MKFLLFDREENYIGNLKDVLEAKHTEEINGEDVLELSVLEQKIENISDEWGRNLLKGTSSEWRSLSFASWNYYLGDRLEVKPNETYTFRVEYRNPTGIRFTVRIFEWDENNVRTESGNGTFVEIGEQGYSELTYTTTSTAKSIQAIIRAGTKTGGSVEYRFAKLEKGSIATPWTPAPEDLDIKPQDTIEKGYKLVHKDKYGFWKEFIVKEIEESHTNDGIEKRLFCESSFYETFGDYIEDKRPSGTASHALSVALEPTRWEVGIVDNLGTDTASFYQISAKEAVQKVAETWKGEIRTRVEVAGNKVIHRYVDILARRGGDFGQRFTCSKNLESVTKTIHREDVITALYGYGKGEEVGDGHGRRIDFASINDGKAYVENLEAKEIWGRPNPDGTKSHVFDKVYFDNCEDKQELLQLTTEKLEEVSSPLITYEAKAIDLGGADLGDSVAVIDTEFTPEIRLKARVIKIVRDLLEEKNNDLTLGNFIPSIVDSWNKQVEFINNFRSKQGVWDRADIINDDGTINAQFLNNLVDELNQKMNSQGGYVYISEDGKGLITYDKPIDQDPTMAIQLLGGAFRIANSKLPNGELNWRTYGTGDGFTADEIIAGILRGGKIHFDLTNGTFLIGDSPEDYIFYFDGTTLKVRLGTGKTIEESLQEVQESTASQLADFAEDVDEAISTVDTKYSNKVAEINLSINDITSRVSSVETHIVTITPHHIILSNENQSIITDSTGKVTQAVTVTTDIDAFKGVNRIAGTIGTPVLKNSAGATISFGTITKTNPTASASGKVTWSIPINTNISSDSGWIEIPITIEGKAYTKKLNWTKAREGAKGDKGDKGTDARVVSITPSQLYFVRKLVSGNYVVTPNTITLTPDFQNCAFSKWEYSTNGTTFTQITRTSSSSTLPYYNTTSMVLTVPKGWVVLEDNDYVVLKITSTTGESDVQTISVLYDVTELESRVNTAEQKITPTAIVQTVRSSTAYTNDLSGKVSTNEIISSINQTAEQIKIQANKIKLEGLVTANSNFKILADGSIETKNANVSGIVTAISGSIGDWSIQNSIYSKHGDTYTTLKGSGLVAFATGAPDPNTTTGSNLQIFHDGRIRKSSDGTQRILIDNDRINFYDPTGAFGGHIFADTSHDTWSTIFSIRPSSTGYLSLHTEDPQTASSGYAAVQIIPRSGDSNLWHDNQIRLNTMGSEGYAHVELEDGWVDINASMGLWMYGTIYLDDGVGVPPTIRALTSIDRQGLLIRADEAGNSAAINLYGENDSSSPGVMLLRSGGQNTLYLGADRNARFYGDLRVDGAISSSTIIKLTQNTRVTGWLQPKTNNTYSLGGGSSRWSRIYLQYNPDVASDIRLKSSIQNIPNGLLAELKEIKPKMYQQGDKWHFGYIAQDVERALYKYALKKVGWEKAKSYIKEFEVLYKDESYLSLVYAEIAVLKEAEMQARIDELEARLLALEQAC